LALILKNKKPLKKIQSEIAPNDQIELLFYDEAFFRRESTITRGWYPRGHNIKVNCPITKEKVGVCGAVNPRDGQLLSLIFDGFDSDTFVYYLKWIIGKFRKRKKIVLILDNSSSHKSNKVTEFVNKHKKRLELFFLPPYSPELNLVERVWKNLRYRVTHNTFFENLEALENAVVEYLKEHAKPNERLTSLCCIK
jgi:putative transposase